MAGLFITAGCTSSKIAVQVEKVSNIPDLKKSHYIDGVPFYPQEEFYCGPTTLTEVTHFYGISTDVDKLAAKVFIPGRQGSLQIEMTSITRQLGFVAYSGNGKLTELLQFVAQDTPVIVLQNNGISWYPRWHYAVVIGYDIDNETIRLHTGLSPDRDMSITLFMKTWERAQFWYLTPLLPDKKLKHLEQIPYSSYAQDLIATNKLKAGREAFKTAIEIWPEAWLNYFLLANTYIQTSPESAVKWFEMGYRYAKEQTDYLNNYAYSLSQINQCELAHQVILEALDKKPTELNLLDTQEGINKLCLK